MAREVAVFVAIASLALIVATSARANTPTATTPSDPPVNTLGEDVFDPPFKRGVWIPLLGRALPNDIRANVEVKGTGGSMVLPAQLDTGAEVTLLSSTTASRLGLVFDDTTKVARILDANGDVSPAHKVDLPILKLGGRTFRRLDVRVVESEREIFLVGFDVLSNFDIVVAADRGMVGLYPAGRAPVAKGAQRIPLRRARAGMRVDAFAKNRSGESTHFELIVDTGSTDTQIPVRLGLQGKLPTWVRSETEYMSVGGTAVQRGRFLLDPLYLGNQGYPVQKIRAAGGVGHRGDTVGLLGNDVMLTHRTVLRPSTPALFLAPLDDQPPTRHRGPGGVACRDTSGAAVPCLAVSLMPSSTYMGKKTSAAGSSDEKQDPRHCLHVKVHPAFGGRSLELGVVARSKDGGPALNPRGYLVYLTAGPDGDEACFPLGSDGVIRGELPELSLLRVRAKDLRWPCDPEVTHCVMRRGALD